MVFDGVGGGVREERDRVVQSCVRGLERGLG